MTTFETFLQRSFVPANDFVHGLCF